jgi:hypothetical protein
MMSKHSNLHFHATQIKMKKSENFFMVQFVVDTSKTAAAAGKNWMLRGKIFVP